MTEKMNFTQLIKHEIELIQKKARLETEPEVRKAQLDMVEEQIRSCKRAIKKYLENYNKAN